MIKKILLGLVVLVLVLAVVAGLALKDRPGREAVGVSRIASGADGDVEYFDSGEGRVVVMLASYARGASDFNELASSLNFAGYRTLAVNARGIGNSTLGAMGAGYNDLAADVAVVLDHAQVTEPAFLVGHAFGNRIARAFAGTHPDRVRAVALLSAGGEAPTPAPVGKAVSTALFGFWSAEARKEAVKFAFFAEGNSVPDYWLTGWYPKAGMLQAQANVSPPEGWADGGNASMLIIQPLEDKAAPPDHAGRLVAQRLPRRTRYVEIANAGHATLPEQPERIVFELLRYFREQ